MNTSNLDLAYQLWKEGVFTIESIANTAVKEGNNPIILDIIDNYPDCVEIMTKSAAKYGKEDTLKLIIDNYEGKINYEVIAIEAIKYRQNDIAKKMISKCDGYSIAYAAAECGNGEMVNYMTNMDTITDYNYIAYYAAKGGHNDILVSLFDKGVDDMSLICSGTYEGKHSKTVDLILEKLRG